MPDFEVKDSALFWESVYREASSQSNGRPGALLASVTEALPAGVALDLGCARGDDAVWLAARQWRVTAIDISETALCYARDNARRAGVADRIEFQRHDLAESFPEGSFDLVTAMFLHSPMQFPRERILRRAADAVAVNGHLLIVEHCSRAPWSWGDKTMQLPTAEDTLSALELGDGWATIRAEAIARIANGPNDQTAAVLDNVIFVQRLK